MAKFPENVHCKCCNLRSSLFRFLSDDELKIIEASRYEVSFKAGETIFKQGGPLTHMACITGGMAKVYLEGDNSKNIILKIIQAKELVVGPGYQVDNRHHYSVSSISDLRACFIDLNAFTTTLKSSNAFSMEFVKYQNKSTIYLHNKILNLLQNHMSGRLAETLLYLSRVIYKSESFKTSLSRQDLADMSAMTKESSIRILKEFKDENVIELEANSFHILDMDKLERMSKVS